MLKSVQIPYIIAELTKTLKKTNVCRTYHKARDTQFSLNIMPACEMST